jgi:hypothetical protein
MAIGSDNRGYDQGRLARRRNAETLDPDQQENRGVAPVGDEVRNDLFDREALRLRMPRSGRTTHRMPAPWACARQVLNADPKDGLKPRPASQHVGRAAPSSATALMAGRRHERMAG